MKAVILGATGLVGQRFVQMLNDHPHFEINALTGSERSVGSEYSEAVNWRMETGLKERLAEMVIQPSDPKEVDADVAFSALPADQALKVEEDFAKAGFAVISNASSHRMDDDVPLVNPEANFAHLTLIDEQRKKRRWDGALATNPNCTAAVLTLSLKPILDRFGVRNVVVSSMQASSGAGYPGVPSMDLIDNIIPFIKEEEEKVQHETKKILGAADEPAGFEVSASCHRVPVLDGHTEAVFVETEKPATAEEVAECMSEFEAEPQKLKLPTAPAQPIVVRKEQDRPQPRLDRFEGNGMSVVVGRVRKDPVFGGTKFVVLGHNTIRGAAGCAILVAECMNAQGYL